MVTAGLKYELGWVELAYRKSDKWWFHDHDVHEVLKRSGIKQAKQLTGNEWFEVDLETAKAAIKAVKEGCHALNMPQVGQEKEIELRPNQQDAVDQTKKVFKTKDKMLWNAKMRFGKTLASLQLIKDMGYKRVLLMTHRPVVKDSWFDDFDKMKMADSGYQYGSKDRGETIDVLKQGGTPFIYFASIQLLRYGGGETNLADYADVDWDLIIIDEAHEGTQTELSSVVMDALVKPETKILELSGTPFNLLDQYEEGQVYTWDYTMEQEAKLRWDYERPTEPNPYGELPRVEMYTFEMRQKEKFTDESKSFNFREFFRVDDKGELVYKRDVKAFLDNISNEGGKTDYPFSTPEYREALRHTLWLLPGVKEATAFEKLLLEHPLFGSEYQIVNVVKDGDNNGEATKDDLEKVRDAIGDDPSKTKTITLTVRKLTTGVNVPEWTGVIFLSNTSSPMNYLQAAFRAQTPYSHEVLGKKETCYVFDFAPDRALTVMAESAQINSGVGKKNTQQQKDAMTKLLNFMPILGQSSHGMQPFNVDKMLTQLKRVYAEKAVRSGFEDDSLYNDNLLTLTSEDAKLFTNLNAIVGKTQKQKTKPIIVSENGLTVEEYDIGERAKKKKPRERTPEEKEFIDKIKEAKKQQKAMISILRGVSIRIPMMIYGMPVDLDKDITIDQFIKAVDDQSWKEFMPKGFSKGMFREIVKYYDPEVFIEAGRIIRNRAKSFDRLDLIERAEQIAELFSTFKNPDKETVLTPWRVVNLQMTKTIGGLNFFDEDFESMTQGGRASLHWVDQADSGELYQTGKTFLDINSKTGLYPLHAAMSLYYKAIKAGEDSHFEPLEAYQSILKNQIYAIAKTPMAKTITERTLVGYRQLESNVCYIEDFSETIKTDLTAGKIKIEEAFGPVKFDVVIGNPPYQEEAKGTSTSDDPIYNSFMELSYQLADKVVLITPARFLFNAGKTPKAWNQKMLNDPHLKVVHFSQKSDQVFPNTDIKGGVAVTYRDVSKKFGSINTFTSHEELSRALKLVEGHESFKPITDIIYTQTKFDLDKLYEDYPGYRKIIGSDGKDKRLRKPILGRLEVFSEIEIPNSYKILGRLNNERVYRYIPQKYIANHENLLKYKVIVPAANGSGSIGEVLSTPVIGSPVIGSPVIGSPVIGSPVIGYTDTFISFGSFEKLEEAEACLKYIKGRFSRGMLGILKITQDNTAEKWAKVPLWDFADNSIIDWTKSIDEIDQQLYDFYGFDNELRNFFIEKIQKM